MLTKLLQVTLLTLVGLVCSPAIAGDQSDPTEIQAFIVAPEYGWQPVEGDISYAFFTDGRLHVQGPDGEATMWEGTWKLDGDQLTLIVPELKKKETLAVKKDGEFLVIGEMKYTVYKP